jgi:hypothetical protein
LPRNAGCEIVMSSPPDAELDGAVLLARHLDEVAA